MPVILFWSFGSVTIFGFWFEAQGNMLLFNDNHEDGSQDKTQETACTDITPQFLHDCVPIFFSIC